MHALSRKAEDYLEAILNASCDKGYARTKDIARELCIQPPTVVEMVQKLAKMGMITYRKYEGVTLTPEGRKIAEVIRDRHVTLKAFLEIMNVSHDIAEKDACMMEHELHPETIEQIRMFLSFIKEHPQISTEINTFDAYSRVRNARMQ